MTRSIADKRKAFRNLHASGCFVIPNPWDVGSARYLQLLGFKAIASSSAGYAFTQALPDGGLPLEMVLAHLDELAQASDLPLNADFEAGYAGDGDLTALAENVRLAVEAGVSGLSIEDGRDRKLYSIDDAVARIKAARGAIDKVDSDVVLVGRAECFLSGRPDLEETIARLRAYSDAGADCLYAPGLRTREQIAAVVAAAAPKPVNVLVSSWSEPLKMAELAALGVRRVSVGGALARVAWGAMMRVAKQIALEGSFDGLAEAVSATELNQLFTEDHRMRARRADRA